MTQSTADNAATAAAKWWSDAVRAPRYDNGDSSGMSGLLMHMLAATKPDATSGQRADFATVLAAKLTSEIERMEGIGCPGVTLDVDYGPDRTLREAAEQAGISSQKFPWKTLMHVDRHYVTVSAGYQAATRLVWASGEWLAHRPKCDRQQWNPARQMDRNYHGEPFVCSAPKFHDGPCAYDNAVELCGECGHRDDTFWHDPMRADHSFTAEVSS